MVEPAARTTCAERAERHPDGLAVAVRKRRGAWFTPWALALPTAARTLAPLLHDPARSAATLRVVDPAVGGGTFLRAALHVLADAGVARRDGVRQLHGLDVDAEAARLAALALHEACGGDGPESGGATPGFGDDAAVRGDGAPQLARVARSSRNGAPGLGHGAPGLAGIAARVRAGDGLRELEPGTFDAVLTNPPWETLQDGPDAKARAAALRPHFVHQGRGKLFTYRLFVERAFQLLRPGGRLGLVVPASLWFDRDAEPLRRLLLEQCTWEWLFGFENRARVFTIDSRYRFGVVVATKGGTTAAVRTTFGCTDVAAWAAPAPPHVVYGRAELRAASPRSGAFVEVESRLDLELLQRMHERGRPLLGADGVCTWRQGDFNMTADRARFVPRADAEASGYRQHGDGTWRRHTANGREQPELLPLWQGAMLHDLRPNTGWHAGGTGRATAWTAPADPAELRPAFLVAAAPWRAAAATRCPVRLALRALSNATNARTTLACLLPDVPCGNSLGVLEPRARVPAPLRELATCAAVLGSLPFDWALRLRLGGTNLNGFVLADCVLPRLDAAAELELARAALRLCAVLPAHDALWTHARAEGWAAAATPALDDAERAMLATRIDVLVGAAFGLDAADVAHVVRGCDAPAPALRRAAGAAGRGIGVNDVNGASGARDASGARGASGAPASTYAKGFWRVDRELSPAARRPNRWLTAVAADARLADASE